MKNELNELNKLLTEALKYFLDANQLTAREFSIEMGVGESYMSRFLSEKRDLNINKLIIGLNSYGFSLKIDFSAKKVIFQKGSKLIEYQQVTNTKKKYVKKT